MIAVEKHALKATEKVAPATPDDIARTAQKTVPTAKVDTHESWLKNLLEVTTLIRLTVLVIASILLVTAALTVAGAAQTRLALHREEIDLLHLMGATDQYIARQFLRHGCRIAVEGALIGIILALITLWLSGALGNTDPNAVLPRIHLGFTECLILAAIPVVAGGIAMVASWITVMRSLKQLP
jgi:cell division transport system permease protein